MLVKNHSQIFFWKINTLFFTLYVFWSVFWKLRQIALLSFVLQSTYSYLPNNRKGPNNRVGTNLFSFTQVGSPAVRLRLARCTAWVKRWSEAMDFLQTIFKTNIFVLRIFENYICYRFHLLLKDFSNENIFSAQSEV